MNHIEPKTRIRDRITHVTMVATLAGCGGSGAGSDSDDAGNSRPDGGTLQISPLGSYAVRSELQLEPPMQVTAITQSFLAAAIDPAGWLCDTTAAQITDSSIRTMVQAGCNGQVQQRIDDRLLQIAPNLAAAFVRLNERVPPLAHMFAMLSELHVEPNGAAFVADHRLRQIAFGDRVFDLVDFGVGVNVVTDIAITWSAARIAIDEHLVPVPFGTEVRIGLDEIVIPDYEPAAANLGALYASRVNCSGVGAAIFDQTGLGSVAMFTTACMTGLAAEAAAVYQQLDEVDSAANLRVASTADVLDADSDGNVDKISGSWAASVIEQGKPPKPASASFVATRL